MIYTTTEAAAAIGVDQKRLDNILTASGRHLIGRGAQGKARTIGADVIELVAIALLLERDTGLRIGPALRMASAIRASPDGTIPIGRLGSIRFDVIRLKSLIQEALADAVEGPAAPRRGRPPGSSKAKRGASG